jgi:hypothetical protein
LAWGAGHHSYATGVVSAEDSEHGTDKRCTKLILRCPDCNLINPPNSQLCDCGYNFVTQSSPMHGEQVKKKAERAVLPIKVSAFWFVVLQAASIFIFLSGAADSSQLFSIVGYICTFTALGAFIELIRGLRRRRRDIANEAISPWPILWDFIEIGFILGLCAALLEVGISAPTLEPILIICGAVFLYRKHYNKAERNELKVGKKIFVAIGYFYGMVLGIAIFSGIIAIISGIIGVFLSRL